MKKISPREIDKEMGPSAAKAMVLHFRIADWILSEPLSTQLFVNGDVGDQIEENCDKF